MWPSDPDGYRPRTAGAGDPDEAAARMIPTAWRRRLLRATVAVAGGVAAVGGSYAVAGASPAFVAAPVANATVRFAPGLLVTFAITVLGDLGEHLASATGLAVTAGLFGVAFAIGHAVVARTDRSTAVPVGVAVAVGLLAVALVGPRPSALGAAAGAAVVSIAVERVGAVERAGDRGAAGPDDSRRAILSGAIALAVGVLALGGRWVFDATDGDDIDAPPIPDDVAASLTTAAERSLDVEGLEPLVSEEFYTVDIANVDPSPDRETWSLRIHGAVEREATFDLADIEAMDHEHRFVTLRCVGESLNGRKLDNALWTGVPIADLLSAVSPQGEYVMLRAADDFYEEFPVAALQTGFLADGMNGRPLPRAHGAPVRALIPGHWGEINVKWLTEIEILDEPATGYWEKRGWHGTGPVNTVAKLWVTNRRSDGRIEVAGHAYAGTRGVQDVEVSTDGGETWTSATLSDPLPGEDVWRQWLYRYRASEPHDVVVRAIDGTGAVQPPDEASAFPNGPSGWVSKSIDP